MLDPASSFNIAWEQFQARDSLRLIGEWGRTQGRAQYLAFVARINDPPARDHLAGVVDRLTSVKGVEPLPEACWHVTVKGAGFQVIRRSRDDEVLQRDVPRVVGKARAALRNETAFDARLGLASSFAEVAFVEVEDAGRLQSMNHTFTERVAEIPRYPFDGPAFLPHVSVARFSSNDGLGEIKTALSDLRADGPGPSFAVREVELVKAWLTEDVPELETVATLPLRHALPESEDA